MDPCESPTPMSNHGSEAVTMIEALPTAPRPRLSRDSCLAIVTLGIATALCGCGVGGGSGVQPRYGPLVGFSYWDSLSATTCRGWLGNFFGDAANVRVELWYATAAGESSRVVFVGSVPGGPSRFTPFFAPPQMTNGEPRYPRVGQVTWSGGMSDSPGHERAPSFGATENWCWSAPDSLVSNLKNYGGWAYHVVVTLENRDGVHDYSPPLGQLATGSDWFLYTAARESLGVLLSPRITGMQWEDYAGTKYSLVPLPAGTPPPRCY